MVVLVGHRLDTAHALTGWVRTHRLDAVQQVELSPAGKKLHSSTQRHAVFNVVNSLAVAQLHSIL